MSYGKFLTYASLAKVLRGAPGSAATQYCAIAGFSSLPDASLYPAGTKAYCLDGLGFEVYSDSSRWVQLATTITWTPLQAEVTTDLSGNEQILYQALIPAGFLAAGYVLDFLTLVTKSGATDTCQPRIRIGTAGTVADTGATTSSLIASTRQVKHLHNIRIISDTSAVYPNLLAGTLGNNSTAWPSNLTIPNISNALYFSYTVDLGGTTDSCTLHSAVLKITRSS